MYEVKNISRYLTLAGLYPGEVKTIKIIDTCLHKLSEEGLVSITEIKPQTVTKKQNQKDKNKECEVTDTNGGN